VLICLYQAYYVWNAVRVSVYKPRIAGETSGSDEKISILIPLYNSGKTIGACLTSILENNLLYVSNVVVILDHSTDDSGEIARSYRERFEMKNVHMTVASVPAKKAGKVAALLEGRIYIETENVLLLDADIILEPRAIENLVNFHTAGKNVYSSPLIYPFQESDRHVGIVEHLVCNNRLYRQGILQNVKKNYGVGNFPGGVQLVNFSSYTALLEDGFVEDLVATYRLLSQGGKVAILPEVLAYEIERQTITGLVLQRIRWTLGAIQNTVVSIRVARTRSDWNQKILISSYHVMWELQHYVITLGMITAILRRDFLSYTMLPLVLYIIQISRSAYLVRKIYRNSIVGIAFHCFYYPVVLTTALVCSFGMLLKNRTFFFKTQALFKRD
jgi:glycosyltransferase involved in cell wall biosynthesis